MPSATIDVSATNLKIYLSFCGLPHVTEHAAATKCKFVKQNYSLFTLFEIKLLIDKKLLGFEKKSRIANCLPTFYTMIHFSMTKKINHFYFSPHKKET